VASHAEHRALAFASVLRAAQGGDRDAQAEIFRAYRDQVARQILRMTGEPSCVDDLLQEVFIAALLALPSFRGDAQLGTWLHTITSNKVRNWWESSRRRRRREDEGGAIALTEPLNPEDDLTVSRGRDAFYDALAGLSPELRDAFIARAVEGLSLVEASKLLGAPISTVSYRTRRAEQLLCAALGLPRPGERR